MSGAGIPRVAWNDNSRARARTKAKAKAESTTPHLPKEGKYGPPKRLANMGHQARRLEFDDVAFTGGADIGAVQGGGSYDGVHALVIVVRVVVVKDEFLGAAGIDDVYGFAPVAGDTATGAKP